MEGRDKKKIRNLYVDLNFFNKFLGCKNKMMKVFF